MISESSRCNFNLYRFVETCFLAQPVVNCYKQSIYLGKMTHILQLLGIVFKSVNSGVQLKNVSDQHYAAYNGLN